LLAQIVGLSLLLASCGGVGQKPPSSSAKPANLFQATTWRIDFQLSGGFAGLDRTLTLSNTGQLTAEDRSQRSRVATQATPQELDQIAALVARIKSLPAIPRGDSRCRDCLSYNIAIDVDGERFSALLDDTTLPGSGLEELARALSALLNRSLSTK
jgi:hypothetical protein